MRSNNFSLPILQQPLLGLLPSSDRRVALKATTVAHSNSSRTTIHLFQSAGGTGGQNDLKLRP
jgi:hypothetical protein